MRTAGAGLPCILVIGEAALAADLITGMIFKHLERNLADGALIFMSHILQVGSKLTTNFQGRSPGDHWEALLSMLLVFDFQQGRRSRVCFWPNRNMHCSIGGAAANNYFKCSKSGSARHWFG